MVSAHAEGEVGNVIVGGVFKHINLIVPAKNSLADFGFLIMEPIHTPPMSGSNAICVATVLLETGMIEIQEPFTTFNLETPAGLIEIKASCMNGEAKKIEIKT